ncbi:hypothetical protein A0H81_06713 [Grifola frondosa]|uniref:Uncharacterized protein n=1 Tax=Grifola frondosa TaxID=5627 RepID=A0A1C7MCW4_GRIFR|nr:hypothetical protein A0H81_06713 [Grifola frondosa]
MPQARAAKASVPATGLHLPHLVSPEDEDNELYEDCSAPFILAVDELKSAEPAVLWNSPWDSAEAPNPELCLVHRIVCGEICQQYVNELKMKKWDAMSGAEAGVLGEDASEDGMPSRDAMTLILRPVLRRTRL